MHEIQKLLEEMLQQIPYGLLEKRLTEKFRAAKAKVTDDDIRSAAAHILTGSSEIFTIGDATDDVAIEVTEEDIEYVVKGTERFQSEQLDDVLSRAVESISDLLYGSLIKRWPDDFQAQESDMQAFKQRLEHRWGKALGKLRMLLTIVREWSRGALERQNLARGKKNGHLADVLLRLHVRACQVTNEIVVLLENGLADGAMARWRTLHEITIVAAVISKFGEDIAERYVHYQIVESFAALKAYERDHKSLGFKAPSKKLSEKTREDYTKAVKRFGKKFGEEYGWAAHHLEVKEKQRVTFAKLEEKAGNAFMRSPYKMASYNVHASPKGVYFRLGGMGKSKIYLAGGSNAGFTDPAQHAAVSLAEITRLTIGESPIFDDLVVAKIVERLEFEIPKEFRKADERLRRDHRRTRKDTLKG